MRSDPGPHLWRQAAELAPLAGGALLATAAACQAAGVPWQTPAAVVALTSATVALVTTSVSGAGASALYAAVTGIAASGWLAWAIATSPWSGPSAVSLLAATVVAGLAYPVARGHTRHLAAQARKRAEMARAEAERRKWPDLLERLGFKGIRHRAEEVTRSGRTVTLGLPPHGRVTYRTLAGAQERVEIAAKLWAGAVKFERGRTADEVLMHVAERDVLADDVPYPAELRRLSVNQPIPVGVYEDGTVCAVTLREVAALIVGLRGSGKSNLINVLIAQLARCVDAVVFMIDLKGGRTAMPWVKPWAQGKSPHPAVDWVATDRGEAEIMLRAVRRGIDARAHSGAGDSEKVIPSIRQPAVILIVEELAVIFGMNSGPKTSFDGTTNATLAGLGTEIVQLGRSEAIDPVLVTQRGTVTMTGGGDLKSQCGLRIGLGVADEADARLIIPDDRAAAVNLARLKDRPGAGIVAVKAARPVPVKFYRLRHEEIADIAAYFGHIRPAPDAALAKALGPEYADRWARAAKLTGQSQPAAAAPDEESAFAEIIASLEEDGQEPNPARAKMHELLASPRAKVMGYAPGMLVMDLKKAGFEVARQTVQRWLKEDEAAGRVTKGRHGNWKAAA